MSKESAGSVGLRTSRNANLYGRVLACKRWVVLCVEMPVFVVMFRSSINAPNAELRYVDRHDRRRCASIGMGGISLRKRLSLKARTARREGGPIWISGVGEVGDSPSPFPRASATALEPRSPPARVHVKRNGVPGSMTSPTSSIAQVPNRRESISQRQVLPGVDHLPAVRDFPQAVLGGVVADRNITCGFEPVGNLAGVATVA